MARPPKEGCSYFPLDCDFFNDRKVRLLRDRPDLALSIYDPDTGARQLISVCKDCHEMLHPEAQRQYRPRAAPLTPERWD